MSDTIKVVVTAGAQGRKTVLEIHKFHFRFASSTFKMSDTIKFHVTAGTQGRKTVLEIHKDASIEDLFKKISEWNGIPIQSQRVIFAGRQLQSVRERKTQYLRDYKIEDRSQLFVVLSVPGGNDPDPTKQNTKKFRSSVLLTLKRDTVNFDDDPNNQRTLMPCGHAFGPESLTEYCRNRLSVGRCEFRCPGYDDNGDKCDKEWEYSIIPRLAVLTLEERAEFEEKLSQNYIRKLPEIQECPKCTTFCIRQNKKDRRVICLFCSKDGCRYEFCWYCLGEWSNPSSISNCGNTACSDEDPRLRILQEAEKKEIVGLADCPSIRACPKCGRFIQHTEACKHMVCTCGQQFCFICLKKPVDGKFTCGNYNSHCKIAPIQDIIPDENEDEEEDNPNLDEMATMAAIPEESEDDSQYDTNNLESIPDIPEDKNERKTCVIL